MELFVVPKSMPIAGRVECGESMVQKNNSKLHAGYRFALDTGRDAANRQHPFRHRSFKREKYLSYLEIIFGLRIETHIARG